MQSMLPCIVENVQATHKETVERGCERAVKHNVGARLNLTQLVQLSSD